MSFRIVQVFIADPNDSLALADRIIYSGTPAPTDLDDNELFFDIDIKSLLATHNAKRVTVQDKTVKDRVQMLEPARIRDLKMQVVTIAQF